MQFTEPSAVHRTDQVSSIEGNIITITMNTTGNLCSEEMAVVTVDTFRPLIQTFVGRMTEDRWILLKSGSPDDTTKILLAELLLEIIQAMTNTLLATLKNTSVAISEELVEVKLGDTLSQSFAEVLDIKDQDQCDSPQRLTSLLAKEVAESVSSALSAQKSSGSGISQHITPPHRLNNMLKHASKMLKKFAAKIRIRTPRGHRQTVSQTTSLEKTSLELLLEDLENKDFDSICSSHGEELQTPEEEPQDAEEEPPQDRFVAETAKVVQEIIERAVSEITEPLLQDVVDSEYEELQSESSFQIEVVSYDISQLIASEVFKSSTPQSKEKCRLSLTEVSSIIKTFFVKVLAKTSILRIVAQMKRKFGHESEAESSQSMQSLIDSFESLLLVENGDKQKDQGGNELCLFPRYKTLSGNNAVVMTNKLTEMMYCYIKYGSVMPEIIPKAIRRKAAACPVVDPAMYEDIRKKIRCFLALINWWQKTQAASHSDRLTLALQGTESVAQSPLKEVAEENACLIPTPAPATKHNKKRNRKKTRSPQEVAGAQEDTMGEINKKAVLFLVERLVSGLYNKAKLNWTTTQPEVIIQRLFERIWAEVEGAELRITPDKFEDLDKAVIKPLAKMWGCATHLLISINLQEPQAEKVITNYLYHHLTAKKRSAISRFFSSLGKALSKPFRRA